ncbi:MAG: zf-TFIIB domain-containing protein [Nocardioidaceae bacterium]
MSMDPMTCPQCGEDMSTHQRGGISVAQCSSCEGIFVSRADLGLAIEQENEWHVSSGPTTQPIPRITPGMTPPPDYAVASKQVRSYLDELFG